MDDYLLFFCIIRVEGASLMTNLKRTMTLNLTEAEMNVLEDLSKRKELSKTTVLRQALRLYQVVEVRVEKGDKLFFEDDKTKEKAEVMML
jgi:hypothetical protein